jgi:cardiolipin synthase
VDPLEIELLRDGENAYPAWLAAIASAKHEVLLEMYWFASDTIGQRIADALAERAKAGCEVFVLFDSIGSLGSSAQMFDNMRAAGCVVIEFNPISPMAERFALDRIEPRDHRKILVIDGEIGFTGGINITDKNLPRSENGGGWRDDAVRIRGSAVLELRALFFDTWIRSGGHPPKASADAAWRPRRSLTAASSAQTGVAPGRLVSALDRAADVVQAVASAKRRRATKAQNMRAKRDADRSNEHVGSARTVQIIGHSSLGAQRTIRNLYVKQIKAAKRVILIANSYFVPDPTVRRALTAAAERGVEVRVLVPRQSDVKAVAWAARALYAGLMKHGVHIHEWVDGMLHAKTALIDNWATVGSYNLDYRSLRFNLEVTACSELPEFSASVERSIRDDLAKSVEVDPVEWSKRPWHARLIEWAFYIIRKLL